MAQNPFVDPEDQTANYNTPLTPPEEQAFQQWRQKLPTNLQSLRDYDLRGAWKANAQEAGNGHLPDTWKKPNHITFSEGSIYASPKNSGTWAPTPDGSWAYFASPGLAKYRDPSTLLNYFQTRAENGAVEQPDGTLRYTGTPDSVLLPNVFRGR